MPPASATQEISPNPDRGMVQIVVAGQTTFSEHSVMSYSLCATFDTFQVGA